MTVSIKLVAVVVAASTFSLQTPGICVSNEVRIPVLLAERTLLAQSLSSETLEQPNEIQETLTPGTLDRSTNPINVPTSASQVEVQSTQAITLQEAINLARRNNPQIEAARLFLERQRATVDEALASKYPSVTFGTDFIRRDSFGSP